MGWGKIKRRFKRGVKRIASNSIVQAINPVTAIAAGAAGGSDFFKDNLRNTAGVQVGQVGGLVSMYNPVAGAAVSGAINESGIVEQIMADRPRPPTGDRLHNLPTQAEARGYDGPATMPAIARNPVTIAAVVAGAVIVGLLIWKAARK